MVHVMLCIFYHNFLNIQISNQRVSFNLRTEEEVSEGICNDLSGQKAGKAPSGQGS